MADVVIPQTSPRAGYLAQQREIDQAIKNVLDSGWYILGKEVAHFEEEFASYVGVSTAIGVANGTDAVHLALRACGVGAGDGVITVSHTAVATVAAIELAGAVPIFVDVDPVTFTMDPDALAVALKNVKRRGVSVRPKAVIPVHLYGHPADMPAILDIAARYDLFVIEDCAQSHGAVVGARKTGAWGHIAAFSFYPTKNLGAVGDGGAVVTNDRELGEKVRILREYGWRERYISDVAGLNSRLDEMQAAILRVKLRKLEEDNEKRRDIAKAYMHNLAGAPIELPVVRPDVTHAFHQYVIRSPNRDRIRSALSERGIGTAIHYPMPVHLQPAYRQRIELAGDLKNTEHASREVLSLPMYPQLSIPGVQRVSDVLAAILTE